MNRRFAQIDDVYISRSGELAKREMQVFLYLQQCRNRRSGRCDPSRATIAAAVRMAPQHVSTAIGGLIRKGWIDPDGAGYSFPLERTELVRETNQNGSSGCGKVVENSADLRKTCGKVVENSPGDEPKRFEPRTKSVRAYKGLNRQVNRQERTPAPSPFPLTDEMIVWAEKNLPGARSIAALHNRVVDYFANKCKDPFRVDWLAAWKTAIQREHEFDLRDREKERPRRSGFRGYTERL